MRNYVFIGGFKRGHAVLSELIAQNEIPSFAFICEEDAHEHEKYAAEIAALVEGKCEYKIGKKLLVEDYEKLAGNRFDLAVVCGWRTVLDYEKLNPLFTHGMLAAHDSLLPKYRGFAPTVWAMINGEKECGVSIFQINEGEVDSGLIYYQEEVSIEKDEDINDVMLKVTTATTNGYAKIFAELDSINPVQQEEALASYTCKRNPQDGKIDWQRSAEEVYDFCRALVYPYPGAFFIHREESLIVNKIKMGDSRNYVGRIEGKVVSVSDQGIEVLCGEGSVVIQELRQGGKVIPARELVKSIATTLE